MSISPLETQRSTSSSSKSVTVNPNSKHHGHRHGVSSRQYQSDDSNSISLSPTTSGSVVSGFSPPQSQQECEAQGSNGRGRGAGGGNGRRSQLSSGNHLLNFQYHPISTRAPHHPLPPPPRRHRNATKPYNKDLFLQANYKFVVFDSGRNSITLESTDPDKQLHWEDIVCLRYATPTPVHCPICLELPLCPQISSCGHVFCFPCILRYLLMGKEDDRGESWKKCPLCFVMISPKDLYTIFIENVCEYNVGDKVEFSLLTRHKNSNVPSRKYKHEKDDFGSDFGGESYDPFSKFTFMSDVDLPVRKAIAELDGWLVKADSGLVDDLENLPYVCAAMEHLEQRKKNLDEHQARDNDKSAGQNGVSVAISAVNETRGDSKVLDDGVQTLSCEFDDSKKWFGHPGRNNSDLETCSDQSADAAELLESRDNVLSSSYDENIGVPGNLKGNIEVKDKDSYHFYQAADGQLIILHSLNMKCLLNHFGGYDSLPDRISGKILQLETVTQSEATRRRFRYLSHFSLTTSFQLCEIDLSESLPPNALLPFMDEIKKREKQRKQVARKERREKIKAESVVESPMLPFPSSQHSFHGESPFFSMDDFEALGTSTSSTIPTSSTVVGGRQLFSSVTRLGFASGHDSPVLKNEDNTIQDSKQERRQDSSGASGSRNTGMASFANVTSRPKAVESLDSGKKGKKATRVLLSTTSGRRY